MHLNKLKEVRDEELKLVLPFFKKDEIVLELGSGPGWQAVTLAENGCKVIACEIKGSFYEAVNKWKVVIYEGTRIPLRTSSIDVVFSSNVLEHVTGLPELLKDTMRVLKDGGQAIHIVPSGSWRFWTNLFYYFYVIKKMFLKQRKKELIKDGALPGTRRSIFEKIIPPRHGEQGNSFTEMKRFSKKEWVDTFNNSGFKIKKIFSNNIFYTGFIIYSSKFLNLKIRKMLSKFLGSSCHVFILEKKVH